MEQQGAHEGCEMCLWEDDPYQSEHPEYTGGANGVSLADAQENFQRFGACTEKESLHRYPSLEERIKQFEKDLDWKPFRRPDSHDAISS